MAMATRLAEPSSTAPATSMRMNFCAPSPSRTTWRARSSSTASSAAAKPARSVEPWPARAPGGLAAAPVANSSTVSLVEVSLSTVVQLKLRAVPLASMACRAGAGMAASVNTKQSMVAMSGAIMPLPLAMPVMRTGVPPISAVRVDALGEGVRGHDAARGGFPAALRQRGVQRGQGGGDPLVRQHLADHAGAGEEDLVRAAAQQGGGGGGRGLRRLAATGAREHVGVAGIDHHAAGRAAGQRRAAPVDRRARAFVAGEHARDRRTRRQGDHHQVRPPLVADARRRGAQSHAAERRQRGQRNRERGGGQLGHGRPLGRATSARRGWRRVWAAGPWWGWPSGSAAARRRCPGSSGCRPC